MFIIFKPPKCLSRVTVFLLILSDFPDHKNLKSMLFSYFINVSLGLGKVNNKWFNPDITKVFITVTFPSGVRYLLFHLLIIPFISSIFSEKFNLYNCLIL